MTRRIRGKNARCRPDNDDVDALSIKSLRQVENDIDVLVLRAAAQQEHVRSFQDLEEWNFSPARVPPQRVLIAVGRDEDLFASADPVLDQHIPGKLRYGRDPAGSPANQRQQRPISQAEAARITFRFDKGIRVMDANDMVSRGDRTEISQAQDA